MADGDDTRPVELQWPGVHDTPLEAARAVVEANPDPERARVVFTAFNQGMLGGPGKMQPACFLPPFCAVLASRGIASHFVSSPQDLAVRTGPHTVVVHIYREVGCDIAEPGIVAAQKDSIVFNAPLVGRMIADKKAAHRAFSEAGLPMPPLARGDERYIFSNAVQDSGAATRLLKAGQELNPERYNTAFIDTRVAYEGKSYFTTVRLMCVGPHILHAYVRAGEVSAEGGPSVHAIDTPLEPDLIEFLQRTLVLPRREELKTLAARIADLLGPGFYSHDLLIERDSGAIFISESGFKFHDWSYGNRIRPIAHALPSHRAILTPEYARRAALLFLAVCRENGLVL